ncbi:MAG: CGNR zinc finger domain-containing protein [Roseiarcus sp.]|uniref:CGNR zinc finger domain-containing protein n=1 Tax=Roseiarcus sp. TaxID=1969460 RepID=UPI003C52ECBA
MKVSTSPPPPSRAGSLDLIADDLALDFANTESGRGFPSHENHLREAEHVAQWLKHAKALPAEDADWLKGEVSKRADLAADLMTQAIALREAIHDIGAALGRRSKPPAASLADLSAVHARCVAKASLAPGVLSCRWRWSVRAAPVEAALGPIALAAVKLFTEGDLHRIRECDGHACGWLFYDRSKNNRRRWCEMEVCGNRAKQRRLTARRRAD